MIFPQKDKVYHTKALEPFTFIKNLQIEKLTVKFQIIFLLIKQSHHKQKKYPMDKTKSFYS